MNWRASILQLSRSRRVRRLYTTLQGAPVVGAPLRRLVLRLLPAETSAWFRISAGLGKGLWVHLDPRFEIDYAHGNYEAFIEHELSLHLKPGSVFYDVGAHIGILSLAAARLVGTSGTVFAFEPDSRNVERIQRNARRNHLARIQVVPCAVWSVSGRMCFERASQYSSHNQGALRTGPGMGEANTIEVDAIALDDFVASHDSPALIKIDVEGAEAAVLRGSERIFAMTKPVVICEIHHEAAAQEVTQWLRGRGYTFEWLKGSAHFPRHLVARWRW